MDANGPECKLAETMQCCLVCFKDQMLDITKN